LIGAFDLCVYGILNAYIVDDEGEGFLKFEVYEVFKSYELFGELYEEMREIKEEKITVTGIHLLKQ